MGDRFSVRRLMRRGRYRRWSSNLRSMHRRRRHPRKRCHRRSGGLFRVHVMTNMKRDAQRSFAWLMFGIGVTGAITILSAPYAIGQHGLPGLWITAVLLIPLILQVMAGIALKRSLNQSSTIGTP